MFYRRKLLLSLLKELGGASGKTRLQKLLFLLCQSQVKPGYDFVPYKFGGFSFSANADLSALSRKGTVIEEAKQWKYSGDNYLDELHPADRELVLKTKNNFGKYSNSQLIRHCYTLFPYFAIFSEIKEKHLTDKEIKQVEQTRPSITETILFTIGYEGISLEGYINKLIQNDVKVLVDVRRNPLSMKYGFSKNQLIRTCSSVNIKYIHVPEVGIESSKRKKLETRQDYQNLFSSYKQNELQATAEQQSFIIELLKKEKRIALTCFEKDKDYCHRSHLADQLLLLSGIKELVHL